MRINHIFSKKINIRLMVIIIAIIVLIPRFEAKPSVQPVNLRCEYLINPDGIETKNPRLSWTIDTDGDPHDFYRQLSYHIIVSKNKDSLSEGNGEIWDTGIVKSSETSQILYSGKALEPFQKYWWAVRVYDQNGTASSWSEPASWSVGPIEWNAEWIGDKPDVALKDYLSFVKIHNSDPDFDILRWENPPTLPSPRIRKSFFIKGQVKQAYLYATAIGCYEPLINGNKPDNRLHAPEISDYDRSLQYQTYDISSFLIPGENVLAFTLADGWALGRNAGVKWMKKFPHRGFYASDRRLLVQLIIDYTDGTREILTSDKSWKICTDNVPIREADNFAGQTIDARLGQEGWDCPGFDDSDWSFVYVDKNMPKRKIISQINEPIRIHSILTPKRIWQHKGKTIVDFGQNIAGHCQLKIKGKPGQEIILRHGEWIDDDGSVYIRSLGYAKATDKFILSGKEDNFEPTFTYHGFQYVEIEGLSQNLTSDMIKAVAITSGAKQVGRFQCSNQAINKLFENVLWTQRNNMISILHDNPSRDERTGAAGDIQIFAQTAIFNENMASFLTKYMDEFCHVANNGQFFSMIPSLSRTGMWDGWIGAPGWCDAGIIIPWKLYENYADTTVLTRMYPLMKIHINAILKENPDLIWRIRHNHNGDWLNANTISNPPDSTYSTTNGNTPDDLFATAFLAMSTRLLSDIAGVIDNKDDQMSYSILANRIKDAFISNFINNDGSIKGNSQGAYSLALAFRLIPDHLREQTYRYLLNCIRDYDYRLSTGFITTPLMMQLLAENGDIDIAYRLLESTRFPSWLYNINNGASTIWERWDAWIPERGFQNNTMNSFDHVAFGAVSEWIYRNILGINPDPLHPGYSQFTLYPRPGGTLTWATGSYESINGLIKSAWKILEDGKIEYSFTIPNNTSANLILQASSPTNVTGNKCIFKTYGQGTIHTKLTPGQYTFIVKQ